ncbi:MAG: autotransporter outer membrane beta-barrel domain-containing protein [Saprospiraceae bacterium]|jgi:hypothetical protein|nr:autotransporter outer membrane beta-barrel domain-containing protein [Saprospiraceae bacterium]
MKNILVAFLLLFFASQTTAQVGIIGGFKNFDPRDWEDLELDFLEKPYPMSGFHAGLDYWFRLKKRRIEFAPELSFSKFSFENETGKLNHAQAALFFNTAFYVFDLKSDCNCPTFSKDGNLFSKGFFLEIAPGFSLIKNETEQERDFETFKNEESNLSFGGSLGAGIDFGFSDIFTLTPIARFYHNPTFKWGILNEEYSPTQLNQLFIGLRLRLHFKEIAKSRYR